MKLGTQNKKLQWNVKESRNKMGGPYLFIKCDELVCTEQLSVLYLVYINKCCWEQMKALWKIDMKSE